MPSLASRFAGCLRFLWLVPLVALLGLASSTFEPRARPLPESEEEQLPPRHADRVRLAVLVVFDQMRGDYLSRWDNLFGPGGFHRLEENGAWFQNCHYPYAVTVTAAGHASLLSGCSPNTHGIIGNDWRDRNNGELVSCVASERYHTVPLPTDREAQLKDRGVSPDRLLAPTLGDALKEATDGQARVLGLSFKDRSAVLPAGHQPDACSWLDPSTGDFVTSTYYGERLPTWVEDYNRHHPADRWFGHSWERFRPDVDYTYYSGPDDVAGEGRGMAQGRTFPHPLTGGSRHLSKAYYAALENSPFGNDLLLGLVKAAIDGEGLGTRDVPDLLTVSFSSNDLIGHTWGPDSQEVLDVTLRSDRIVARLLNYLDARVGRDGYVLVLSADHGVCPLPEVARAQGKDAGRFAGDLLKERAEAFLDGHFGSNSDKGSWIAATSFPWTYLNQTTLRQRNLQPAEVEKALADWLVTQPAIQAAYTRSQLLQGMPADDPMGQAVWRSFYPERSGDVMVVQKPYYLSGGSLTNLFQTGTTHGTPHPYDTHVPLLVFGRGIRPGVRTDPVTPQAAAAILARALAISPPAKAEAPVPEGLFLDPQR